MEKIIVKIQKLLALSASCNEHEAALAASHAQRLLALHNLKMADIMTSSPPEKADTVDVAAGKSLPKWSGWIASSVAQSFGCRVVHMKNDPPKLLFIGVGLDVEAASYTYMMLEKTLRRLAKSYLQGRDDLVYAADRERIRRSYYLGAARAVSQLLSRQAKDTPVTTGALVVLKDQLIQRRIEELGPLRNARSRSSSVENDAYQAGQNDGRAISVNKGIKGSARRDRALA